MPLTPISFHRAKRAAHFWSPRLKTASVTARVCLEQEQSCSFFMCARMDSTQRPSVSEKQKHNKSMM